jgi:hypothetical protein
MLLEFGSDMSELVNDISVFAAQTVADDGPEQNTSNPGTSILNCLPIGEDWGHCYAIGNIYRIFFSFFAPNMVHNDTPVSDSPLPSTIEGITADCPQ